MSVGFRGVEPYLTDHAEWIKRSARSQQAVLQGKTNNTTTITLEAGTTTTTLTDPRITFQSVIALVPTTANAAAALATTYQLTAGRVNGEREFTHDNNGQTDRTFDVTIVG